MSENKVTVLILVAALISHPSFSYTMSPHLQMNCGSTRRARRHSVRTAPYVLVPRRIAFISISSSYQLLLHLIFYYSTSSSSSSSSSSFRIMLFCNCCHLSPNVTSVPEYITDVLYRIWPTYQLTHIWRQWLPVKSWNLIRKPCGERYRKIWKYHFLSRNQNWWKWLATSAQFE